MHRSGRWLDSTWPMPRADSSVNSTVRCGQAGFHGQSGCRARVRRRRRTGRRAEGHAAVVTPSGWGWTANIGFGLLADEFKNPRCTCGGTTGVAGAGLVRSLGQVPLSRSREPSALRPPPGLPASCPPRRVGGNRTCATLRSAPVFFRSSGRRILRGRRPRAGRRRGRLAALSLRSRGSTC